MLYKSRTFRAYAPTACLLLAALAVFPSAAMVSGRQAGPGPGGGPAPPEPLVAQALVDPVDSTITFSGFDFPGGVPAVSIGVDAVEVVGAGASDLVVAVPPLAAGSYLAAFRWPDGREARFTVHAAPPPTGAAVPPFATGVPPRVGAVGTAPVFAGGDPGRAGSGAAPARDAVLPRLNTRVGSDALANPALTGAENSAFGAGSLQYLNEGAGNTAVGVRSLNAASTGAGNTAVGRDALRYANRGDRNVAVGSRALYLNEFGGGNTAVGADSLSASTGGGNTAVGASSGSANTTGSNNLYLASPGVDGESGVIRIGVEGTHTKTYIAGELVGDFKVVPVYQ